MVSNLNIIVSEELKPSSLSGVENFLHEDILQPLVVNVEIE